MSRARDPTAMDAPLPPPIPGDVAAGGGPVPASEPSRNVWGQRLQIARAQLFAFFFFAAFIFLLYQLYRVFSSFLEPIIWAAILAMLFYPVYLGLCRWLGERTPDDGVAPPARNGRPTLAALIMTVLVAACIVLPLISLSSAVTREGAALVQQLTEFVRSGRLNETLDQLRDSRPGRLVERLNRAGWQVDYGGVIQRVADTSSTQATAFARNIAAFFLNLTIMLFTLFFLFRDGKRMYRALFDLLPMDHAHKEAIFSRLYETLSAVMRGMVVTAFTQGVLTWLGLLVLGMPYAAFLGVLATLLAFIPFVGAAGIWVPCAIYLAATGDLVRAGILAAYGAGVISLVDNFLRPYLIGEQTRLPTIFLFFGILGGIEAYGVLGIFLGPVLLAIVVAFVKIYKDQYAGGEPTAAPTGQ